MNSVNVETNLEFASKLEVGDEILLEGAVVTFIGAFKKGLEGLVVMLQGSEYRELSVFTGTLFDVVK